MKIIPIFKRNWQWRCKRLMFFWDNFHLYLFKIFSHERYDIKNLHEFGIALKHRRKDNKWREVKFFLNFSNDWSYMFRAELSSHLSRHCLKNRILKTKKYIRFKISF